jgi:hypothetical protein
MDEFPAWMSTLTIKEQIALLEKPQAIGKTVAKFCKYFLFFKYFRINLIHS